MRRGSLLRTVLLAFTSAAGLSPSLASAQTQSADRSRGSVRGTVVVSRAPGAASPDPSPVLVYLVGFTEPAPSSSADILQRDKRFLPNLLGITAGQRVSFPNGDRFYHNVFSPSSVRKFDLGQYRPGETRSRAFPKTGVVDVYCNIHPQMSATILVLPNRRFATADPDGTYAIDGVPPGRWTIYAYSRRAAKPVGKQVLITAGTATWVDFQVMETRSDFSHLNKYGEKYPKDGQPYP